MTFSLSTRWNAGRHHSGESLIEEILGLGIQAVELGYDLTLDLVPGIQKMVADGAVKVTSVHNYCPVPMGASAGHPELFTLASTDPRVRESAIRHTTRTLHFAAEMGARVVVLHCGNVEMSNLSLKLMRLAEAGGQFESAYEKTKIKLITKREKKAPAQLNFLYQGLEQLLPVLQETKTTLALENLPTWEAMPTELEMEAILRHFDSPHVRYWHDFGHAQIRENLGLCNHRYWLQRLQPFLAGVHIHDVAYPAYDHLMPPDGKINFNLFAFLNSLPMMRVLEPSPAIPRPALAVGLQIIRDCWQPQNQMADVK